MKKYFSMAGILACTSAHLLAAQMASIEEIVVEGSKMNLTEHEVASCVDIYTQKEIKASGAQTIYQFLSHGTTVGVAPAYGNSMSQLLDFHGFGLENGYQNIVIVVDGRRINNIDGVPQLLASIPLNSVQQIEIIKGSGSVEYGDGATAGVIAITTKGANGVELLSQMGSYGQARWNLSGGYVGEHFSLLARKSFEGSDGNLAYDATQKDRNWNHNQAFDLKLTPTKDLMLSFGKEFSSIDTRYASSQTLNEFLKDPSQLGTAGLATHQAYATQVTKYGFNYTSTETLKIVGMLSDEFKTSAYAGYLPNYYVTRSYGLRGELSESYFKFLFGIDGTNGDRQGSSDTTSKNNQGIYVKGRVSNGGHTLEAGLRGENVRYEYIPTIGNRLSSEDFLKSWDIGYTKRISQNTSFFTTYNHAFLVPNIDNFFTLDSSWNTVFNGFIKPQESNTLSSGIRYSDASTKAKVSLFWARLKNEIYYYNSGNYATSFNTNIDKSSKKGFDISLHHDLSSEFYTRVNYAYVDAKIDHENEANGAYDGKRMPGVSPHSAVVAFGWKPIDGLATQLSQVYRSVGYAQSDFDNANAPKQRAFYSTDLSVSYRYKNYEIFGAISNLMGYKNGVYVDGNTFGIYTTSYEPTYRIGLKASF